MSLRNDVLDAKERLRNNHPIKGYVPFRVTTKLWRCMLLNREDTIVVDGKVMGITAKSLGAGVYELALKGGE